MYPQEKKTYIEQAYNVQVSAGASTFKSETLTTDADGSTIVGVVVFHEGTNVANNGIVSLGLKDTNGKELSPLSHVDNYRSRESAYCDGFKPIVPIRSGEKIQYTLTARKGFISAFEGQIILIKEKENC